MASAIRAAWLGWELNWGDHGRPEDAEEHLTEDDLSLTPEPEAIKEGRSLTPEELLAFTVYIGEQE